MVVSPSVENPVLWRTAEKAAKPSAVELRKVIPDDCSHRVLHRRAEILSGQSREYLKTAVVHGSS